MTDTTSHYVFLDPEPRRKWREPDWCNPGEPTNPGRRCTTHHTHHWCGSCLGFYGVPHEPRHGIHGHWQQCACRHCRTYREEIVERQAENGGPKC